MVCSPESMHRNFFKFSATNICCSIHEDAKHERTTYYLIFATLPERLCSLLFCPKAASFLATPDSLLVSTNKDMSDTCFVTNSCLELSVGRSLQHKMPWMTDTTRDSACLTPPTVSCQRQEPIEHHAGKASHEGGSTMPATGKCHYMSLREPKTSSTLHIILLLI